MSHEPLIHWASLWQPRMAHKPFIHYISDTFKESKAILVLKKNRSSLISSTADVKEREIKANCCISRTATNLLLWKQNVQHHRLQ